MKNNALAGHIAAGFTILIWGTTFVSTKVLLGVLSPAEILVIRFLIGYLALWCVCPRPLKPKEKKQELYFATAGLYGVTLYYLLENFALTYTQASNVGVIISIAPFFTVIFACLLLNEDRPAKPFYIGFAVAMAGIILISFPSGSALELNPVGDLLAVIAAVIWAGYSTVTKILSGYDYNVIQTTRRIFFYGLIFMIPVLLFTDFKPDLTRLANPVMIGNLLFLGLGASALCFVTWNFAVKRLGSVKTSVYIYMVPVITAVASALILREEMTDKMILGIALTLLGLFLCERGKAVKVYHRKR